MFKIYNQMFTVDYRSFLLKRNVIFNVFNSVAETASVKSFFTIITTKNCFDYTHYIITVVTVVNLLSLLQKIALTIITIKSCFNYSHYIDIINIVL